MSERLRWRGKVRLSAAIALALGVFLLGVEGWTGEAGKGWEAEWRQLVQAAEQEGKVTIAVSAGENKVDALRAFQKRYPKIQAEVIAFSTSASAVRVMAERRAGKYLWDLCMCGTATPFKLFYQGKILDPIKPMLILPEVLDQSKWLGGKHQYLDPEGKYIFIFLGNVEMSMAAFNKDLINPAEFKSYWDLLAPKWKGKIILRDPRGPGVGGAQMRFFYYHPKIGPEYVKRLFTDMDPILTRDDFQAVDWLARGKSPLCVFCRSSYVTKAERQGLPIDLFPSVWREGVSIGAAFGTISLMNRAPHPNAVKVYINWLFSRDGQTAFQEIMNRPPTAVESLRTDIPKDVVPKDQRRREGVEYVMSDRAEWLEMEPIFKFVDEALAQAARQKSSR